MAQVNRSDIAIAWATKELHATGVQPDNMTWHSLVKMHVNRLDFAGARAVMERMRAAGVQPDKMTWTTMFKAHV